MSYPRHDFATYLVKWPDGVIKAGVTNHRRWAAFLNRGARLVMLHIQHSPVSRASFDLEAELERVLAGRLTPAFANRHEAVAHLGSRGGGWMECYRAETPEEATEATVACLSIMLADASGHCSKHLPAASARTDGRTYRTKTRSCGCDYLQVVNACETSEEILS